MFGSVAQAGPVTDRIKHSDTIGRTLLEIPDGLGPELIPDAPGE